MISFLIRFFIGCVLQSRRGIDNEIVLLSKLETKINKK